MRVLIATSVEFPSRHSVNQVLYSVHLVFLRFKCEGCGFGWKSVDYKKQILCTWFLFWGCSSARHRSPTPFSTSLHPPLETKRGKRRKIRGSDKGKEGRERGWGVSAGIPVESRDPSRSRGEGSTWREIDSKESGIWKNPKNHCTLSSSRFSPRFSAMSCFLGGCREQKFVPKK